MGVISSPFTPDELALAQAVAEATHLSRHLVELPGRCVEESQAFWCLLLGINKVREKRGESLENG
jgi:hypothetical protein